MPFFVEILKMNGKKRQGVYIVYFIVGGEEQNNYWEKNWKTWKCAKCSAEKLFFEMERFGYSPKEKGEQENYFLFYKG